MPHAVVPTQKPAYEDLSVQTEWGQGVTQALQWDSERREVQVKPQVILLHMVLLAPTRSVSHAHSSNWRGTGLGHGQVEASQCGFGKRQLEPSARGPRQGEVIVSNRPYGGRWPGKFSCADSRHVLESHGLCSRIRKWALACFIHHDRHSY